MPDGTDERKSGDTDGDSGFETSVSDDASSEEVSSEMFSSQSTANVVPDETQEEDNQRAPAADEQYCQSCGAIIKREAAICPECGVEQATDSDGDGGVAAILSGIGILIPIAAGAGQIYNGDIAKGVIISIVQVINALLLFVAIGFITYPIVGIYAIYDAYKNG